MAKLALFLALTSLALAQTAPDLAGGEWTGALPSGGGPAYPAITGIALTQNGLSVKVSIPLTSTLCGVGFVPKTLNFLGSLAQSGNAWIVTFTDAQSGVTWTPSLQSPFDSLFGLTHGDSGCYPLDLYHSLTIQRKPAPAIARVVNSASLISEPISPGKIVTLFGSNLGPSIGLGPLIQGSLFSTERGGVSVTMGGYAAPVLYVDENQINVQVPFEVARSSTIATAVSYNGRTSAALELRVVSESPAIFTANGTGKGGAAALNQDGSFNRTALPALRGEYVTIFLTGHGSVIPAPKTGSITTPSTNGPLTPAPISPVLVRLDGFSIQPSFAGEAPGLISGVLQVNFQIPDSVTRGDRPLSVRVGSTETSSGVVLSVW